MSNISTWSTTAGSNNSAAPDGFPEGMAPGGVNDSAREVMAQVRAWYEDAQWIDFGYTHTYGSATTFTIAADVTADYTVGRRLQAIAATPGTIYGTITASSYGAPNTTVTVSWDSGSLSNEAITSVSIHINDDAVLTTDTIDEATPAAGVTIDGLLIKDGAIAAGAQSGAYDLNGEALTLDADSDLKAIANNDDRLDVELSTKPVFSVDATEASSVNGIEIIAAATGNPTKVQAQGDDTNIDVHLVPKGTGTVYGAPGYQNLLINGNFLISQRSGGVSYKSTTVYPNSDDSYVHDRWLLLSDGNDRCDVQSGAGNATNYGAIILDAETVSGTSEKFGICQILEHKDSFPAVWHGAVSLSFEARTEGGEVENLRAHILEWDGTRDVVTSDVVSAWNAEGSNPTFVANWTAANTAADLAVGNTFATFKIENVALDLANTENLAVFIHVDDTDLIASDRVFIKNVQLVFGPIALPWQPRPYALELAACQRYFAKTYDQGDEVATSTANGSLVAVASGTDTTDLQANWRYPVEMRTTPTVDEYSTDGVSNEWFRSGANIASAVVQIGTGGCRVRANAAPTDQEAYSIQLWADAEL